MKLNLFASKLTEAKQEFMRNAMVHFNFNQGLFQSKGEAAKYISEEGKEYIPYDYNFANDIVPAINNLLPDVEKSPLPRKLKNVKVFLQGSLIGICFKGFDFGDVQSAGALFGALIFRRPVSVFMIVYLKRITTSAFVMITRTHPLNLTTVSLTAN